MSEKPPYEALEQRVRELEKAEFARKQMEDALRESEEQFRSLAELSPYPIAIIGGDGTYEYINSRFIEVFGYTLEDIPDGREWFRRAYPDTVRRKAAIAAWLKDLECADIWRERPREYRITIKDGSEKDILFRPVTMRNGRQFITCEDITERKRAEEALRESEQKYHQLFLHAPAGIYEVDFTIGRFTQVNPVICDYTGYSREELLGMGPLEILTEESRRFFLERLEKLGKGESVPLNPEFCIKNKDGSNRWVQLNSQFSYKEGSVVGATVVAHDITERVRAEEALRESEAKYRSLFNQSVEGIFLHDLKGRILDVNQMACLQSGYSRDELLQLSIFDLHPDRAGTASLSKDDILRLWSQWRPEQRITIEVEHRNKDGTVMPVQISTGVVRFGDRNHILAIVQDISERKLAEEERNKLQAQLNQAQKMESVGRLAGGVAHDFNNMLSVIIGNTELALDKVLPGDPLHDALREIQNASRRSADITRQLLAFARKQTIAPRVLDLNKTIKSMLKMLRRLIGEDIELDWLPGENVWPVRMDPSQIDQILANLCVNSRDAIADGGRITIKTDVTTFGEADGARQAGFVPGDFVLLAVSDDGCGMDRQTLANLFEPFFTTKDVDKGTGLGLATVYGIVKQNKGFINVASEPGRGTTFRIYLPRHETAAEKNHRKDPAAPDVRGSETILLVEDEPSILRIATMMLERIGYAVLTALTPGEAISLAREHTGEIHLLMTDVVMPEMNGRDLAGNLLSLYPNLKRLFMSGYTADVIAHHGVLDEGVQFIQKPFTLQDLAIKVREVLDEVK